MENKVQQQLKNEELENFSKDITSEDIEHIDEYIKLKDDEVNDFLKSEFKKNKESDRKQEIKKENNGYMGGTMGCLTSAFLFFVIWIVLELLVSWVFGSEPGKYGMIIITLSIIVVNFIRLKFMKSQDNKDKEFLGLETLENEREKKENSGRNDIKLGVITSVFIFLFWLVARSIEGKQNDYSLLPILYFCLLCLGVSLIKGFFTASVNVIAQIKKGKKLNIREIILVILIILVIARGIIKHTNLFTIF